MFKFMIILCCSFGINAQRFPDEAHSQHKPYAFAYTALNEDGSSHSREEIGDANGRITGFYSLQDPLTGGQRRVEYLADENGFRASVSTNEIGTESQNAANAEYFSSAPTAAELVARYEASGEGNLRLFVPGVNVIKQSGFPVGRKPAERVFQVAGGVTLVDRDLGADQECGDSLFEEATCGYQGPRIAIRVR